MHLNYIHLFVVHSSTKKKNFKIFEKNKREKFVTELIVIERGAS